MSTEIGRIEKPGAESRRGERRIFLVPLVFAPEKPPAAYIEIFERYWEGVEQHVSHLEARTGAVKRIYHESIAESGDEALAMLERFNAKSVAIAKRRRESGASLEALEDPELLAETVDWQRCLMIGLTSQKVAEQIWQSYDAANRKRYEHMLKRIEETLQSGESGLLFIGERHRLQFPSDIQVFYVAPPALDEINRWLHDRSGAPSQETPEESEEESGKAEPETEEAP